MASEEKMKALDAALAQIEKQYGKGSVMKLGDQSANMGIDVVPTGSLSLDLALGLGGMPRGRIIEIYGPESSGKKVIVVGTGISGIGAVKLLCEVGAQAVLYDGNDKLDKAEIESRLPEGAEADIVLGTMEDSLLDSADLAVISPGVPIDSPVVVKFNEKNIPVWGEIELAYNYEKGIVAAITGTNGKTTTTTLVGEIIKAWGRETFVVGNIGNSYTAEVLKTTEGSVTVAEISSFQLETVHEFHPKVSAILNITPDHLNRHYTMENYAAVKERIAANQTNYNHQQP